MKRYTYIRNGLLTAAVVWGLVLTVIGRIPTLPTSADISPSQLAGNTYLYLQESLCPLLFCCAFLVGGVAAIAYGFFLRRHFHQYSEFGHAGIYLGYFVLLSAVWILTDSQALAIFTTEAGGILNKNAIVSLSYMAFMLLPIAFIAFVQHIRPGSRWLDRMTDLFTLNLVLFVLLLWVRLPQNLYMISLFIHHILMYTLMIAELRRYLQTSADGQPRSAQERALTRGLVWFICFSAIALVAFLAGKHRLYSLIYGLGFLVLGVYMCKVIFHNIVSMYKGAVELDVYRSMAYTDMLTGLHNRNAFVGAQDTLTVDTASSYIVMDINHFKWINDTFGHHFGDELIGYIARLVKDAFGSIGTCYRIGGDEFVVICQGADEAAVQQAIAALQQRIRDENAYPQAHLSVACGYAFGQEQDTANSLFAAADEAMYQDKRRRADDRERSAPTPPTA